MSDLWLTIWAWLHTREGRKLFRYTMSSVITTGVSLLVLGLVFGVFRLWTEVPSTIFANVVAAVPSYYLARMWAWGKGGRSHLFKEVLPFCVMSAASISFSMIGAATARYLGERWHLTHLPQTGLVLFANVLSFSIFWVLKLLVFNRTFKVPSSMEETNQRLQPEPVLAGAEEESDDAAAAVS
ncbi:MAG: GtrA family protein [Actinomycetota bacterium]|nr:GtrA family protein [Actinomycetota bacterium]